LLVIKFMVKKWSVRVKLLTLRVLAIILLSVHSNLTYAYNDLDIPVLRSFYNAKEATFHVTIYSHFFYPLIASGESLDDYKANLNKGADLDKSLRYGGRVSENVMILLSDKLEKRFSIKRVDWKDAPYYFYVQARVVQAIDLYGDSIFHVRMDIDFHELGTTRSGKTGFMPLFQFTGINSTDSKGEIETKIYETLDKAIEKIQETSSDSIEYCTKGACKLPEL
jgi:hypothetical protein